MGDRLGPKIRHCAFRRNRPSGGRSSGACPAFAQPLNSPVGVCRDRSGNVWVCDTGNNRLLVFDGDLTTLRHVPSPRKRRRGLPPSHSACPSTSARTRRRTASSSPTWATAAWWLDLVAGQPCFAYALGDSPRGFSPSRTPTESFWCALARRLGSLRQ